MRRRLAALVVATSAVLAGCAIGDPQPTTEVTDVSATLNGNVYSNVVGDTEYWWRYGTTTGYGSETTHRTVAISDDSAYPVSEPVSGLAAATTYHFQLCARDDEEDPPRTNCSSDRTFTTDPEPDGSMIAFVSDRDNNDDVFITDSNGNHPENLTESTDFESTPTWSPDRTQIAYGGDGGIHVMDADGSDDTTLPDTGSAFDPAWSPDGDQIAFARSGGEFTEIWVMDTDGSNQTQVTDNVGTSLIDSGPAWSPDGDAIVFSRATFDPEFAEAICIVSAGGGAVSPITDHGSEPDWSPDGDRIAFTSTSDGDWEIYAVDTTGLNEVNLTDEDDSVDTSPSWSPDGSQIAYERIAPGIDWNDIYVMDADGTNKLNYTPDLDDEVDDTDPDWSTLP